MKYIVETWRVVLKTKEQENEIVLEEVLPILQIYEFSCAFDLLDFLYEKKVNLKDINRYSYTKMLEEGQKVFRNYQDCKTTESYWVNITTPLGFFDIFSIDFPVYGVCINSAGHLVRYRALSQMRTRKMTVSTSFKQPATHRSQKAKYADKTEKQEFFSYVEEKNIKIDNNSTKHLCVRPKSIPNIYFSDWAYRAENPSWKSHRISRQYKKHKKTNKKNSKKSFEHSRMTEEKVFCESCRIDTIPVIFDEKITEDILDNNIPTHNIFGEKAARCICCGKKIEKKHSFTRFLDNVA